MWWPVDNVHYSFHIQILSFLKLKKKKKKKLKTERERERESEILDWPPPSSHNYSMRLYIEEIRSVGMGNEDIVS
jgi:hypothetical protein